MKLKQEGQRAVYEGQEAKDFKLSNHQTHVLRVQKTDRRLWQDG